MASAPVYVRSRTGGRPYKDDTNNRNKKKFIVQQTILIKFSNKEET